MRNREFHKDLNRLILIARAEKRLKKQKAEIRERLLPEFKRRRISELTVKRGRVQKVISDNYDIPAVPFFKKFGQKALRLMKVSIGDARKEHGDDGLKGVLKKTGVSESLKTYPKAAKASVKVAV